MLRCSVSRVGFRALLSPCSDEDLISVKSNDLIIYIYQVYYIINLFIVLFGFVL